MTGTPRGDRKVAKSEVDSQRHGKKRKSNGGAESDLPQITSVLAKPSTITAPSTPSFGASSFGDFPFGKPSPVRSKIKKEKPWPATKSSFSELSEQSEKPQTEEDNPPVKRMK